MSIINVFLQLFYIDFFLVFHTIDIYKMSIPFRESSFVLIADIVIWFYLWFDYFVIWFICLLFNRQQTRNLYSSSKPVNIKIPFAFWLYFFLLFVYMKLPCPFIGDWCKGYYQYSFVLVYPVGIFYLLFWVFVMWHCFINDNGWLLLNVCQFRGGVCRWTVVTMDGDDLVTKVLEFEVTCSNTTIPLYLCCFYNLSH